MQSEHRGAVANEQEAILAARKAWYCIHPDDPQSSEQSWLKNFAAAHEGATWHVATKAEGGPTIGVKVTTDGHIEDVQSSQ